MPSMAVNKSGDMIVVHSRVPIKTSKPIAQEVRYRIFYHDQRGLRDGAVLHAGSDVLAARFCSKQQTDTVPTPISYFHEGGPCPGDPARGQDYATAVADPNGPDFWLAAAFAQSGNFKMVAGKVTP
jgi:hypothetical protein